MSLSLERLVDPYEYDAQVHTLCHDSLDRLIELSAQADISHSREAEDLDDDEAGDDSEDLVESIRSQANFTPAERAELRSTGLLFNCLIGVCIARRSALFQNPEPVSTDDHPDPSSDPDHPA